MQSHRTSPCTGLCHCVAARRIEYLTRLFRFVIDVPGNRSNVVGMMVGVLLSAGIVFWLARDWWRHPDL